MDSNTTQSDVEITTPPNSLNSDWSQDESDISMDENFLTNFQSYDSFESLESYALYGYDCVAPQTLSMSSNNHLETPPYPPLSPFSLFQSAELYGSDSSIGVVAHLARHSSLSETQPQTPDDASSVNSAIDTNTISLCDGSVTGTPPHFEASFSVIEPSEQLASHSMEGLHSGHIELNDYSDTKCDQPNRPKKLRKSRKKPITKEEKELNRRKFFERNRIAANKYRQNRKNWINELQEKCERISTENARNEVALIGMAKEIVQLRKKVDNFRKICRFIYKMPPDLHFITPQQPAPSDLGFLLVSAGLCQSETASHVIFPDETMDSLPNHAISLAFPS